VNDFRFAVRQLLKQPAFTAIAVITFALGIGANTAIFSVLNAVLLRSLPFWQPQNLVALGEYDLRERTDPGTDLNSISYPDFADWRAQNRVFERVAVYTNQSVTTLTDGKEATHVQGEAVSADLFPLLGVQPVLGRNFLPNEDDPGNHVVILSDAFWQRRFGANPNIIGQSLTLDGQRFQVVGIMPPRFSFPISSVPPEAWTTMSDLARIEKRRAADDRATRQRFFPMHRAIETERLDPTGPGTPRHHYGELAPAISRFQSECRSESFAGTECNDR
jgi:putative ABC transport system permease protein